MRRFAVVLALFFVPALAAQNPPADSSRAAQDSALRVFVDCPGFARGCDQDYFRTEITYVNYVRNREDAQVHVLITTAETGGGGTEYTLAFIGRDRFAGQIDTLRYYSKATDVRDDDRRGLVRILKMGLMRFVATTPLADRLQVEFSAPVRSTAGGPPPHDPWNYWAFNIRMNGNLSGEQCCTSVNLNGGVSANRTTDAWKINLSANAGYNENGYTYQTLDTLGNLFDTTVTKTQRDYSATALIVKSLTTHWSLGGRVFGGQSTFLNTDLQLRFAPGVEYDFYPYSQSTRRLVTLLYEVGVSHYDYIHETIYDKASETLFDQSLTLSANATQPWGNVNASFQAANYLHDFSKYHLTLFGGGNIRIFKGLSFNIFGSVEKIHDQLYLSSEGLTPSDVLLQRRQLATSYRYFTFFGLSYQFGSIFNNVVNPRFGGSSGGIIIMN